MMEQLTLFAHSEEALPLQEPITAREALHSSQSCEWYTPHIYIEAVRQVLGTIELDPASCERANLTVSASRYFDEGTDGLAQPWPGNVFLNPPYGKTEDGQSNQALWSQRLLEQYEGGITTEAILLVNAATGDRWFQGLWLALPVGSPICFTRRIKFYTPEGQPSQPTHGNAFVYMGQQPERFIQVFKSLGVIAVRVAA